MSDSRPRTAVLHQFTGIGDLIWHVQYFKAIAQSSQGGRITVIAQPSTMARAIVGHEPWVEAVIDHDHRPRRFDRRKARHGGLLGMWRMAKTLRAGNFDRIILFSGRSSRGLLAAMTGIPERSGYGYRWLQRLCLTRGPYIPRYSGPSVAVLKEAGAFAVAHGFCQAPIMPSIDVPEHELVSAAARLAHLPMPRVALAIGTSEPHKQWGEDRFLELACELAQQGHGVVILGGKAEQLLAASILSKVPAPLAPRVHVVTDTSILGSAAILKSCQACVGNDTGMVSMSAAVQRPTVVLLGNRPTLDHDPLLISLRGPSLQAISVPMVMASLASRLVTAPMATHPASSAE